MEKLKPIIFGNDMIRVHPIQNSDETRLNQISENLLDIFSDTETVKYSPEKYISSIKDAKGIIAAAILGYTTNTRYINFITHVPSQNVIGEISIISPTLSVDKGVKDTWLIEFYLLKELWNNGIMTGIVAAFIDGLKAQNVRLVGAFVNVNNIASIKILEKCGFRKNNIKPDSENYYYELNLN